MIAYFSATAGLLVNLAGRNYNIYNVVIVVLCSRSRKNTTLRTSLLRTSTDDRKNREYSALC